MSGVFKGYGSNFDNIGYNTPDYNMLANLEKNVYSFSAAKNYQEIRHLTSMVSEFPAWNDYRKEAAKVLHDYNVKDLHTEFNTCVAGAQMASKWVAFEEAGDNPYLKYETVGDRRVRDEHRLLDGIIKPMSDSFWKTYYPPNGWNCRCTVIELPGKAHETPDKNITYPDIPKMWQVNTAQQNIIFPEGSPYFIAMPEAIKKAAFELLPYERRYETLYTGKNGGKVLQHIDVQTHQSDYKIVSTIAKEKADKGDIVHILPRLDNPKDPRRAETLKGAKYGKNPDLRINGEYVEVKQPKVDDWANYNKRLADGASQADHVILNVQSPKDLSPKALYNKFKTFPELKTIENRCKGKYTIYHRPKK